MKNRLYQIRVSDALLDALGAAAGAVDASHLGRGGGRREITRADLILTALSETWGITEPGLEEKLGLSPRFFVHQALAAIRAARFAKINREFDRPRLRVIAGGAAA